MRKELFCDSIVVEDDRGRVLVERRAETGMWAGLWQAPTLEGQKRARRAALADVAGVPATQINRVEAFTHITTHRTVRFNVWRAAGTARVACPRGTLRGHDGAPVDDALRAWRTREEIAKLGLSRPQRRILLGGR